MRGIIIAAGRGLRMRPMTAESPKCMLPIGNTNLLSHTVGLMRAAGCDEVAVITGHQGHLIERNDIITVRNEDFANNNVLHSLLHARDYLEGEIIVSYSDIWVEPPIYQALMATAGDIVLAADRDWEIYYHGRTDHPYAEAENVILDARGRVAKIGKHLMQAETDDQTFCEFLGLWKMSAAGTRDLVAAFDKLDRELSKSAPFQQSREWQKAYVSDLIQHMVDDGYLFDSAMVERGWAEIDTVQDYERLPSMVDPLNMHVLRSHLEREGSV